MRTYELNTGKWRVIFKTEVHAWKYSHMYVYTFTVILISLLEQTNDKRKM